MRIHYSSYKDNIIGDFQHKFSHIAEWYIIYTADKILKIVLTILMHG